MIKEGIYPKGMAKRRRFVQVEEDGIGLAWFPRTIIIGFLVSVSVTYHFIHLHNGENVQWHNK